MDRESALKRIRKCLALAESEEPHEAAAALRQARALMDKFHVTESEAELSEITESSCLSSGKRAAPAWEAALAKVVGETFGCRVLHSSGRPRKRSYVRAFLSSRSDYYRTTYGNGSLHFVGAQPAAEIARYAFEALRRQLRRARASYREHLGGSGPRLDAFVIGWVMAVQSKLDALAKPVEKLARADDAIRNRYGPLKEATIGKDRSGICDGRRDLLIDAQMGALEGRNAELNSAVAFSERPAIERDVGGGARWSPA